MLVICLGLHNVRNVIVLLFYFLLLIYVYDIYLTSGGSCYEVHGRPPT